MITDSLLSQVIGPIVQGLGMAVNHVSKACKVRELVNAVLITCVQAQSTKVQFRPPPATEHETGARAGAEPGGLAPAAPAGPGSTGSGSPAVPPLDSTLVEAEMHTMS